MTKAPPPYQDADGEWQQEAIGLPPDKQAVWDANVQAVIDAKAAIADAKKDWNEVLRKRSVLLNPLLRKQRSRKPLTPEEDALIVEQDAIVRDFGKAARARVRDLEVARARFKAADGARIERPR